MTMKAYERTLEAWAAEFKAALAPETVKLIAQANYDLYNGPVCDGAIGDPAEDDEEEWQHYPGFIAATRKIRDALDDVPSRLSLDTDAECRSTFEPGPEECPECNGDGEIRSLFQSEDAPETETCSHCDGHGVVEPFTEGIYETERRDLVRALVGRELVEYVS